MTTIHIFLTLGSIPPGCEVRRDIFWKKSLKNLYNQLKLIIFVVFNRTRDNSHVLPTIQSMDDEKFKERIIEAVALMLKFRETTDKSDKRIIRDTVRAVVKEITRV